MHGNISTARRWVAPLLAASILAAALGPQTRAQPAPQKLEGKIVCGSFSGDPKKYPAWQDNLTISISQGAWVAIPSRPEGHALKGVVAPSGAVLVAGEGGPAGGPSEWTYEFAGRLNQKGLTVLKGRLADIQGGGASRACAISF